MVERSRRVETRSIAASRRFVTGALRAGRRMTPTHALIQCDVTETRSFLEAADPPLSWTAFLVAAVARAAAAHPEVHAYVNWAGRLVVHHHVDVSTLVEVVAPAGSFPLAHLIRDADIRSPADLSTELRQVKREPSAGTSGRLFTSIAPWVSRIPGAVALFYWLAARSTRMRRLTGTVSVTAVGMFGRGGGLGIGHPTVQTLTVLVGGRSVRPWVKDGEVVPREILDLTVSVDHNVVDGAPAARFVADLREIIEHPETSAF
jgi:pyruvate/2-oxoglutarate dehydrogenase complex dihydrolipoamide acyltransferase (E2) component